MSGWGTLGDMVGGGLDTQNAYDTGRLRTAQTENALLQARQTQLKNMAAEFQANKQAHIGDTLVQMGVDPTKAPALGDLMNSGLAPDFNQTEQGLGHMQNNTYQNTLGDAMAPIDQRLAASSALTHKVQSPYDFNGQNIVDLRAPNPVGQAPTVFTTPIGQSEIGFNNARAQAALDPTLHPGAAGTPSKPAVGFEQNPLYDPNVTDPADPHYGEWRPVAGGPHDPLTSPQGVNLITQQNRVLEAAGYVGNHLDSIVAMPLGTTQGVWGSGDAPRPDAKWSQIISSQLKYGANPEAINEYNSTIAGVSGALAALEMQGMRGAGSFARQFDSLAFRDGDGQPRNIGTMMYKLASLRQTLETGLMPMLAQPGTPPAVKAQAMALVTKAKAAVPFTPVDVLEWQRASAKNPRATIGESMQQAMLNRPINRPPPGTEGKPGAAFPATNSRGWRKMRDAQGNYAYVGPNGEVEEIQ